VSAAVRRVVHRARFANRSTFSARRVRCLPEPSPGPLGPVRVRVVATVPLCRRLVPLRVPGTGPRGARRRVGPHRSAAASRGRCSKVRPRAVARLAALFRHRPAASPVDGGPRLDGFDYRRSPFRILWVPGFRGIAAARVRRSRRPRPYHGDRRVWAALCLKSLR